MYTHTYSALCPVKYGYKSFCTGSECTHIHIRHYVQYSMAINHSSAQEVNVHTYIFGIMFSKVWV